MINREILTKENFWNKFLEKYAPVLANFYAWVDRYKEAVGWQNIFKVGTKFHDLPAALQMGIFLQWVAEEGKSEIQRPFNSDELKDFVTEGLDLVEP